MERLGGFPDIFAGALLFVWIIVVIWSAIWKGIALWKAGRNGHLVWFIVMFLVNTAGILEIIYIFGFSKKSQVTAGS